MKRSVVLSGQQSAVWHQNMWSASLAYISNLDILHVQRNQEDEVQKCLSSTYEVRASIVSCLPGRFGDYAIPRIISRPESTFLKGSLKNSLPTLIARSLASPLADLCDQLWVVMW